jgi:hypothetical protein
MRQIEKKVKKQMVNFDCLLLHDYQCYERSKTLFEKQVYCTIDRTFQNFLDVFIHCDMVILDFVVFFCRMNEITGVKYSSPPSST